MFRSVFSAARRVARGVGEHVTPLPTAGGVHAVVVFDGLAADTGEMYRRLDAFIGARPAHDHDAAVRAVAAGDPRAIAAALSNDFDALTSSPLAELLRTHGALGAMLTGSGSAAFGIFADAAARGSLRCCARRLRAVCQARCSAFEGIRDLKAVYCSFLLMQRGFALSV